MLGGRANYWHLLSEELPALYRLKKWNNLNDFQHLIIHQSRYEFKTKFMIVRYPEIKIH